VAPSGLIRYLLGPGRAQEHTNPRVIAAWDGRDTAWQPVRGSAGRLVLGPLITALEAPAIAAGLPTTRSGSGRRGYVWHCSARVAATDRPLSDGEWSGIARELLHGAGIAETGDGGGPRWVAVRHADDHIHIAVVLVRQDDCRRIWPRHDYTRLRVAAREIERRHGLTVTAPADGTAARTPSRAELEKAARQGALPARVELRRAVRRAAIAAHDVDSFVLVLGAAGYKVQVRRGPSGDALGYAVARSGDRNAAGEWVFYSGSRLAADLSLPALQRRWREGRARVGRGSPWVAARRSVRRAHLTFHGDGRGGPAEDPAGVAGGVGDVLVAVAGRVGVPDGWVEAAELAERAGRVAGRGRVALGPLAADLRRAARGLLAPRRRGGGANDEAAMLALAVSLTALLVEIARWHQDQRRPHQAAAADAAARTLAAYQPSLRAVDQQLVLDITAAGRPARSSRVGPATTRSRAASPGGDRHRAAGTR